MNLLKQLLQDVLSIISKMSDEDVLLPQFVAVFISLLRQAPEQNFLDYLDEFDEPDLINFEVELLLVLRKLIEKPVFHADWCEMVMLQNNVFMKILRLSSKVLREKMMNPFVDTVWVNYFQCAVLFITLPSLQLERFAAIKCAKICNRYKDLRIEAAVTVTNLWRSLRHHQLRFIVRKSSGNSLIGPLLEMTMLPVVEVRRCTIPIFYDMMSCEFNSVRSNGTIKGKFSVFESEMLEQLDALVELGRGDEHYKDFFVKILSSKCKENSEFTKQVLKFVMIVGKLMEKLLQYRNIKMSSEHSPDLRMCCTASVLDFYVSINRKELYLRYVYKLVNLHYQCNNFTEAAYTLKNHADLLSWNHEVMPDALRSFEDSHIKFHDDLKERLYYKIIKNFCTGKMWEAAVKLSKELLKRHEEVTLNYNKVAHLLSEMSKFYQNIMDPETSGPKPGYFRVAYYGRGFPAFLQNKVFVYRGNDFERIADFQSRILIQFPNAELMKNLSPPDSELKDSAQQYIQINSINCEVKETDFTKNHIAECIRQYYEFNHIDTFTFYRPFHRGTKDPDNEFATLCTERTTLKTNYELPGLLKCFPVMSEEKIVLSPLENAIKEMKSANQDLEKLIKRYASETPPAALDNLTRKLTGMVDAAVMGGIKNYEKAFLTPEYEDSHPDEIGDIDALKSLISDQVPLLELALDVHASLVDEKLADLHCHLMNSFKVMKTLIQKNYGISANPPELEQDVKNLRRLKGLSSHEIQSARSSHYSTSGADSLGPSSSPSRMSVASVKSTNTTIPRIKKHSSATIAIKKNKSLGKNKLRRDSFCGHPKSATSWFARPDSGIFMQESSSNSLQEARNTSLPLDRSYRLSEALHVPLSPLSSNLPTLLFQQSLPEENSATSLTNTPTEYETDNSSLAGLVLQYGTPSEDVPPPLPVKSRNLDPERLSLTTEQSGLETESSGDRNGSESAPDKPPRPTYQSLNFKDQIP